MGSCMSSNSGDGGVVNTSQRQKKTKAFQGTGNRLGSANDQPTQSSHGASKKEKGDELPPPRVDPTLTKSDRDRQREARLAAAEQRQKKNNPKPKKKKAYDNNKNKPLVGPNSQPTMRWTAS